MSDRDASPQPQAAEAAERRRIQRFLGQRRGQPYLWVTIGSERVALRDISVDGFAIAAAAPPAGGSPSTSCCSARACPTRSAVAHRR